MVTFAAPTALALPRKSADCVKGRLVLSLSFTAAISVISPRLAHTLRQCFELDTAFVGNRRVANRSWKSAHALSAAKVRQTMGSHASLEMNERRSRSQSLVISVAPQLCDKRPNRRR